MKNTLSIALISALLLSIGLACKNPVAELTESKCSVNLPKLVTATEYVERGSTQIIGGNYDCAFNDCQNALKLDPKNTTALACRGVVYHKRERFDLAQKDFDESLQIEPNNLLVLYQRSQLYQDTQSYELALADVNNAISQIPTDYYYALRAAIYFDKGDYENAVKDYAEAIRLKPDNEDYYAKRARVYRYAKQIELAEADEEKAKQIQLEEENSLTPNSNKTSGAVVNDKAVSLPKPVYPPSARAVKAGGEVRVEIATDAKGNVTSAKAVAGHPLLRPSAEAAARQAKFKPSAMTGILVFNFTA